MSVIQTTNLTKQYGSRRGIEAISLRVEPGAILGFLGPNGAGKTTTIRILLGFMRASAGTASIMGHDCWSESRRIKGDVGYLPSDLRLYSWMTGNRAIEIAGLIRGRDLSKPARALAERFDLEMNLKVRAMSRGMRQKLGLILTLAHTPRLLVLDEPTSGLDPLMQEALAETLREFAARGRTVFFSSHTLSEIENLCDRVAIIRDGRIVADEPLKTLRERAHRSVTLTFHSAADAANTAPPPGIKIVQRSGVLWRCELIGPGPGILEWARAQRLADIEIAPPDMEMLFHSFYRDVDPDRAETES